MKGSNRAIFALLVVVVVAAAVLAGYGIQRLSNLPAVTLPPVETTPAETSPPTGSEAAGYLKVEVTPETVQSVVATLVRPRSYERVVTVTNGDVVTTARVLVDAGWTMVEESLAGGQVRFSIVGDGKLYLWYSGDATYYEGSADRTVADLAQRLPTYEDVLALDKDKIAEARYESRDDLACVFLSVLEDELGYVERYWIAVRTGLLVAAETEKDGVIVYRMTGAEVEAPVPPRTVFRLPDGTALHSAGAGE